MATLTIDLDEELFAQAERRAAEDGTSVEQVLGAYLRQYASGASGTRPSEEALALEERELERRDGVRGLRELWALIDANPSGSGPGGRSWTREDIYDRSIMRRDR